jgi:hypothetical protein
VATSTCEPEYMDIVLAMIQWIWLTNTLEEPIIPATTPAMFCYNKATIDIPYNDKIGNGSKQINVTYRLIRENVESGPMSLFQVESAQNLADICTKNFHMLLYGTFGLHG